MNEIDKKDKLLGMMWGAALGDALGAPYEFRYGRIKYQDQLTNEMSSLVIGQVTDDTELMLSLAHSIAKNKKWDREDVIKEYCNWATSDTFDIGNNTKQLFYHPFAHRNVSDDSKKQTNQDARVVAYEKAYEIIFQPSNQERWTQSNGCLMRVAPTVFCPREETTWLKDCILSNPHPVCQESVDMFSCMLHSCLDGSYQFEYHAHYDAVKEAVIQALERKERDLSKQRGWVVHGLYCALRCFTTGWNFTEAMRWVIGEHLDSDTDTNACIAGAIMGAKLGYQKLVQDPITRDNINIMRQAKTNRPDKYHPKCIDDLVDKLLDIC